MDTVANNKNNKLNALSQSFEKVQKWLSTTSKFLVLLCIVSGSMVASLKFVNCRLFGSKLFDMGLPRYKQEEFAKHQLWLTVALENIPQIVLATSYALVLVEFNTTVLFALTSSIISVLIAVISAFLQYPKKYYIFQLDVFLLQPDNQIQRKIRKTERIAKRLSSAFDQEYGFCFVENEFVVNDAHIIFNVVANEPNVLKSKLEKKQKSKIMDGLKNDKILKLTIKNIKWCYIQTEIITIVACNCPIRSTPISHSSSNSDVPDSQGSDIAIVVLNEAANPHLISSDDRKVDDGVNNQRNYNTDVAGTGQGKASVRSGSVAISTNGWEVWTCEQVSEWLEQLFINDSRLIDQDYIINTFMNEFNKHRIDGPTLLSFKNDEKEFEKFQNIFANKSFAIWSIFTNSINSLK